MGSLGSPKLWNHLRLCIESGKSRVAKHVFNWAFQMISNAETLRHHEGNSPKWITIGFQGPKVETPNITKQRFRLQLDHYAKVQWGPKTLSWPPKFQIHSVILIENLDFLGKFIKESGNKWWKFEFSHSFNPLNGRISDMPSCTAIAREQEDLPQPNDRNLRSTNQLCIRKLKQQLLTFWITDGFWTSFSSCEAQNPNMYCLWILLGFQK